MNNTIDMTEKEYRLLVAVESGEVASQRKLAMQLNISLGMINLCLRRLIKQGYIKTYGLNKNKVKYLLTSKGFSEKMRKTYFYTQKTIRELAMIKQNIQNEIRNKYLAGERSFKIAGMGEISDIAEIAIKNLKLKNINYKRINKNGADVLIVGKQKYSLMSIAVQT